MRKNKQKAFKKFGGKPDIQANQQEVQTKPKERDLRVELFTELRETLLEIESRGPDLQKIVDMQKKRKDE